MPLQKTEAIVLKSIKQGETSKILTLYTRHFGKIKVIAKGARSSRSRFGGSLEPLTYISIVYYEKESRDLQILSQADIIESFARNKQELETTTISMAACELIDRLEFGVAPSPLLFKLLLETIRSINGHTERPMNCLRALQVRLLDSLGIKPDLNACMKCRQPSQAQVLFDVVSGGYICQKCRKPTTRGMLLSKEALDGLKDFQTTPLSRLNGLLTSNRDQQQVDHFLFTYLRYHVEGFRELNALKFYKRIMKP
ncbi:DNA repair protein RecO [candidate division KSB1 bacterium]|nr:DNA repair protein RecO [candidate division KSB1 bacterium]NIR68598.1 DNA repair protein RecO [candidate division KSB1 bacterium]NIS25435.1 DNA repair protein RecO [candidate division KSB1 bacterium]NIT72327.1 DNA repair protein RecO [candidate division KSB1 bacterium]NIU26111.1 DNA repair protein RecO [candidate division KSB1 bacterium]